MDHTHTSMNLLPINSEIFSENSALIVGQFASDGSMFDAGFGPGDSVNSARIRNIDVLLSQGSGTV